MNLLARLARWTVPTLVALVLVVPGVIAEEVKGKWRIEIHAGAADPGDEIQSDADNQAAILRSDGSFDSINDPRFTNTKPARLDADSFVELRASYGIHSWKNGEIILDIGIGHYDATIEDIEFAFALDRDPAQNVQLSSRKVPLFTTELIDGGTLKMIPVSASVVARYRPTKRFNPYVGAGIGYFFNEFNESDEWRTLADALDKSVVGYMGVVPGNLAFRELVVEPGDSTLGFPITTIPTWVRDLYDIPFQSTTAFITGHDMQRPRIDAPDSAFFEVRGGAEWQWRANAAIFGEMRFSWASEEIKITADGREKFGTPVPNGLFNEGEEPAPFAGLPAYISSGGIVTGQGPQPGFYYLNGGVLDFGGFTFTIGLRFTM
ncbi:MAG: hypothetical protein OEQ13_09415 [Acidobacteriota bacterium]|nr:hypothetical protein [Acidobacteriota bacterium]